jgi:hypothetical protein
MPVSAKTEPVSDTALGTPGQLILTDLEELGPELQGPGDALILLNSDTWGAPGTGRQLMEAFLGVLADGAPGLTTLVLVNRAVLLAEPGPASYRLSALERQGVDVLLCATSAREHGVTPVAGRKAELPELARAILQGKRVITL